MNYSSQQKKTLITSGILKNKLIESKPYIYNHNKQYEDDQTALIAKNSDSIQVRDLKGKIKLVMTKLTTVKKQKDEYEKQNKILQLQINTLQSNLRHMVSGFSNTSCSFPTSNQLISKFAQFYKYECLDLFFDILCPDMSIKGTTFFYYQSFRQVDYLVKSYFSSCFQVISQTGCFDTVQGPISNVLRKAFQSTYQRIIQKLKSNSKIGQLITFLKTSLKMEYEQSRGTYDRIRQFIQKVIELQLFCFISDPPLSINMDQIGKKVVFNHLIHDPFDGFIKPKDECWIILPSVQKENQQKQLVSKSLVLQINYDQIN